MIFIVLLCSFLVKLISSKTSWDTNTIAQYQDMDMEFQDSSKHLLLKDGTLLLVYKTIGNGDVVRGYLKVCKDGSCGDEQHLFRQDNNYFSIVFDVSQVRYFSENDQSFARFILAITNNEYPVIFCTITIDLQTQDVTTSQSYTWGFDNLVHEFYFTDGIKENLSVEYTNIHNEEMIDEFVVCWEENKVTENSFQMQCRYNQIIEEKEFFIREMEIPNKRFSSFNSYPSITRIDQYEFVLTWLNTSTSTPYLYFSTFKQPEKDTDVKIPMEPKDIESYQVMSVMSVMQLNNINNLVVQHIEDFVIFGIDYTLLTDTISRTYFSFFSTADGGFIEDFTFVNTENSDLVCLNSIDGFVRCVLVHFETKSRGQYYISGKLLLLPENEDIESIFLNEEYFEFQNDNSANVFEYPKVQLVKSNEQEPQQIIESIVYFSDIQIVQQARSFFSTEVECGGNHLFFPNDGCLCAKGSFEDLETKECTLCKMHYYQDENTRNKACIECPGKMVTLNSGSTSVDDCGCYLGQQFSKELNECEQCPLNTFKNVFGIQNCTKCMENAHTVTIGSTTCECDEGYLKLNQNCISITTILEVSAAIVGSVFGGFILLTVLFFLGFCLIFLKVKKKANRFDHIEGVDMILKEAELDQKNKSGTTPTIKVKESNYIIDFKEIKIIKTIGNGASSSIVYLASWNGIECAFKGFSEGSSLVGTDKNTFVEFEREVAVCVGLNHPSIVQFYGASITPKRIGLLLQYCVHGDLCSFLKNFTQKNNMRYELNEKIRIIKEITAGMEYLHSRNLIHRDLKLENVLLDENEKAKIMDFGLSKTKQTTEEKTMTKMIGTAFYMSPEIIKGNTYSFPTDVFSWAILVFALMTERFQPYGNKFAQTVVLSKVSNDKNFRPNIFEEEFEGCEFLIPIIKKNWDSDPQKRNTFTELKEILSTH